MNIAPHPAPGLPGLALLLVPFALAACSAQGGSNACDDLQEKLVACGALSPGTWPCESPETHLGRCEFACAAEASCADAQTLACSATASDSLAACALECSSATCTDGSTLSKDKLCDGVIDCPGASDERPCSDQFVCADGLMVYPLSYRCDGLGDCFDDSDELGCPSAPRDPSPEAPTEEPVPPQPPPFPCADGQRTVPGHFHCDDASDCGDGSDERGCVGWRTCRDVSRTIQDFRFCDTIKDCDDGSDEAGCALLNCDPAAVLGRDPGGDEEDGGDAADEEDGGDAGDTGGG